MANLAINGGAALYPNNEFSQIPWPPVSLDTAEHLKQLYLSREWSFNSPTEQEFEDAYSKYHDAKRGVFMVNGTVTLETALIALGVGAGDEVIVPGLTWMATAMAAHYVGAKIVFADIDPNTYCMDPASFEARITPKTKAVIPVHLYGSMADVEKICAIAEKHNIAVIEDCAHMHGGKWNGKGVGSWGKVGSFSFQQSKTLSSGEGGICITNDDELAMRMYRVKHIGYPPFGRQGHASVGPEAGLVCHNYRGLAFTARILLDQLPGLDDILSHYDVFVAELTKQLADVPGVKIQQPGRLCTRRGYYGLCVEFDPAVWGKVSIQRLTEVFAAEGIHGFITTYGPVYKHILFNLPAEDFRNDGCPVADRACEHLTTFLHYFMYKKENAERFANVARKILANMDELEA